MVVTHRTPRGAWHVCPDPTACTLPHHLPGVTPAAAARIPLEVLLPLLDVLDPPQMQTASASEWQDSDGWAHRLYDLPAFRSATGTLMWFRHGLLHRAYDRPAIVYPQDDGCEYWVRGRQIRVVRNTLEA